MKVHRTKAVSDESLRVFDVSLINFGLVAAVICIPLAHCCTSFSVISLAMLLFLIMDPFGNLIVVHSLLAHIPSGKRRLIVLREGAFAAIILLLAALFGSRLLSMLQLNETSLRLAGGIVLFLIALGMLFPSRKIIEETAEESPLIVPIAMPLIAGPSAISMVILFSEKHLTTIVAGAILLATVVNSLVLSLASPIFSLLRSRGAIALERLMGMLLILISVQMVLDSIEAFIAELGK